MLSVIFMEIVPLDFLRSSGNVSLIVSLEKRPGNYQINSSSLTANLFVLEIIYCGLKDSMWEIQCLMVSLDKRS